MRLGQVRTSEPVDISHDCSFVQGWGLTPVAGPELAMGRTLVRLLKGKPHRTSSSPKLTVMVSGFLRGLSILEEGWKMNAFGPHPYE